MSFEFLANAVTDRKKEGLTRKRVAVNSSKDGVIEIAGKHYLNFASNDYLGLSQHEQVQQAFAEGLALYGTGSGASSVVTGYSVEHKALEDDICSVLNKQQALIFSSGFSANQALCHALFPAPMSHDHVDLGQIVCDKYMHASFIQGALETPAKLSRFKHNDTEHAKKLIGKLPPNSAVATEGVFSMDGDRGKINMLSSIIADASLHPSQQPYLIVDDAHAFGVVGKSGFGSLDYSLNHREYVEPEKVDIVMGTFGKAVGTSGAFIAGSHSLIDYMVNFSKHYIYSTAPSGASVRATRASLALIEQGQEREKLHSNIEMFLSLAKQYELNLLPSTSAIQALIFGCPNAALVASKKLSELGIWVPAIRTPTVPKNSDRLRITLSAVHTHKDITVLVDALLMVTLNE